MQKSGPVLSASLLAASAAVSSFEAGIDQLDEVLSKYYVRP